MARLFFKLRNALLHNKGAKFASLFLAGITWYAIEAAISFETLVTDVPLIINVKEGWAILDRSARTVDVLFRGSQDDIRYLNRDQITVEVDVRGEPVTETLAINLDLKDVKSLGTARPVLIQPGEITLRLDQEGEKQVPVKADFQGEPPEGYELEKIVCTPASVKVYGPRRRLREIDTIHTSPIDLEGRIRTFRKLRVELIPPSETWVARVEPSNVMVDITIAERSATKDIRDIPLRAMMKPGLASKVDLWPQKVMVTVGGRSEILKNLGVDNLNAYVDCTALEAGNQYELPIRVTASPGVTIGVIDPPSAKVNVIQ